MSPLLWVVLFLVLVLGVASLLTLGARSRRKALQRLRAQEAVLNQPPPPPSEEWERSLARWLGRAGYRGPHAVMAFVVTSSIVSIVGAIVAIGVATSGLLDQSMRMADEAPGGFGAFFLPVLRVSPFLLFVLIALVPVVRVRAARRRLVISAERDMPLTLDLLATLAEAGMGFDGALARILESEEDERPLGQAMRTFQAETLAGVPRVEAFRRLAERLNVPSVSIFVSALIQAERVGAGLSETLRRQSEDLRNRRREQALMFAQSLPVKLVFPLVICFLPGLFVFTMAPAFFQFIKLADSYVRKV
jgi:tight adherence protein C